MIQTRLPLWLYFQAHSNKQDLSLLDQSVRFTSGCHYSFISLIELLLPITLNIGLVQQIKYTSSLNQYTFLSLLISLSLLFLFKRGQLGQGVKELFYGMLLLLVLGLIGLISNFLLADIQKGTIESSIILLQLLFVLLRDKKGKACDEQFSLKFWHYIALILLLFDNFKIANDFQRLQVLYQKVILILFDEQLQSFSIHFHVLVNWSLSTCMSAPQVLLWNALFLGLMSAVIKVCGKMKRCVEGGWDLPKVTQYS